MDGFNTFSIYQVLPQLIELWGLNVQTDVSAKKTSSNDHPMTTPLFLLRCVQLGISIRDLDLLTIGLVNICMLKTATMLIKDIRKWRLRRTSTNFNQQFIINFARYKSGFGRSILKGIKCEKSLSLPWCKLGDFY